MHRTGALFEELARHSFAVLLCVFVSFVHIFYLAILGTK